MKKSTVARALGVLFIAVTGSVGLADAPPLPARFYGTVKLSSANVPTGTLVSAWINGGKYAETSTTVAGGDSVYVIDVPGDDPETTEIEGGREGDTIVFQVAGYEADQTPLWSAGTFNALDLTATPPPTPPVADDQAVSTSEDNSVAITLTASDVNAEPLTFSIVSDPAHGTLSGAPPDLTYAPDADYNGPDSFTFKANDGTFDSNTSTVSITVRPSLDAPRLSPIGDQVMDEGTTREVTVLATDPDGDPTTLSAVGLPAFASFTDNGDGTGTLVLAPSFDDAGVYPGVEVVASDGSLSDREFLTIRVNQLYLPDLTISGFSVSDPTSPGGTIVTLSADICNEGEAMAQEVVVRFFLGDPNSGGTVIGSDHVIAELPVGSCDSAAQDLNVSGLGESQVLYVFADPDNAIAEASEANNLWAIVLNIQGVIANVPPIITSAPVITARVDNPYAYDVEAIDLDGDPVSFALLAGPHGMTIDPESGLLQWLPRSFDVGDVLVEVEARDSRGGTTLQAFTLTVKPDNDPPVITSTPVTDAAVREAYLYQVEATDPEGGAISFFLLQGPTGMHIEQATGTIRWTPWDGQEGVHNVMVQAIDEKGAEARQTYSVRILSDEFGPDLVVAHVDNRPVDTDTQALTIAGAVDVTVGNAGSVDVSQEFELLLFYDEDGNSLYDSGTDAILGQGTVSGLAARETTAVSVSVSGSLPFRDDLIHAFVDSTDQVAEAGEGNNIRHSGEASEFRPKPGPFTPKLKWAWTGRDMMPEYDDVMMTPLVVNLTDDNGDGQINTDDIPDVVFVTTLWDSATDSESGDGVLRAISGEDGSPIWDAIDPDLRVKPYDPIAAGDLDGDGLVEIIAGSGADITSPNAMRLLIFEHDGTFKYAGDIGGGGTISLIDMDSDGSPEIVIDRRVYNADGTLRFTGAKEFTGAGFEPLTGARTPPSSAVLDLDLDGQAELVTGIVAYRADGSIYYDVSSDPRYFNPYVRLGSGGNTAFGNFNDDPYPEIVVLSGNIVTLLDHNGGFLWQTEPVPAMGPPTVADFDGDGLPEVGSAEHSYYSVIDDDGTLLWKYPIAEASSGFTGSSVFDFEGDGAAEVVYADEQYLYVFRGNDGTLLFQSPNPSGTYFESPVIADVDNDGQAEIIVSRNQFGDFGARTGTLDSGIFVYEDQLDNWVGTRRIWNQHGYYITNVNEDGTIPHVEIPNWQVFNNFRQNEQLLEEKTSPYAVPDLTASLIRVDETSCPGSATLSARIGNGGGDVTPAGVSMSFYDGDPDVGAPLIGSVETTQPLLPGEFEDLAVPFADPAPDRHLITVVADDGGGPVLVDSENLIRLEGVRVADYDNFNTISNPIEQAVDGNVFSGAIAPDKLGGGQPAFMELAFPHPVNISSVEIIVYSHCNADVSMSLSNGFTLQMEGPCTEPATIGPSPAIGFSAPAFPLQHDVTSLRFDLSIATDLDIREIIVAGSYLDPSGRRGVVAERREDNNQAVFSTPICGDPTPGNLPPEILSTPATTAIQEILYQYDVVATDRDGDPLHYALVTAPAGMTIDADNGQVRWIPRLFQEGDFAVTLEVSDGQGGVTTQDYVATVSPINFPPEITSSPVTDALIGLPYSYDVEATDAEGTPLSFSLATAPSGMGIDPDTGLIQWRPLPSQVGSHAVSVQVRDVGGANAEQSFAITVSSPITGSDLVVSHVDNRPSITDLQTLGLDGQIDVTFGNAGDTAVLDTFQILLFADMNDNGTYESGTDTVLGSTVYEGGLDAGQFVTQAIDVSGTVLFRDNLIFALVDSGEVITEADETNNITSTGAFSRMRPIPESFTPVVEKVIRIPNPRLTHAPLVANLNDDNGDGVADASDIPDIVFVDDWGYLRAFRGDTGEALWSRRRDNDYNFLESIPAVGDIDEDGFPEIAIMLVDRRRVAVFSHDGTPEFVSEGWPNAIGSRSGVHLANVDRQGLPEILVGNVILNADGTLRCQGTGSDGGGYTVFSTAVDLDLEGDLELVAGNTAYRSDCSIYWQNTAFREEGWVSVGNLDDDPHPEIVLIDYDNQISVLEHDGTIKAGSVATPGGFSRGLAVIADFDGDGMPEIGISGARFTVFESDLTQLWSLCCNFGDASAFDFEGDGQAETLFGTISGGDELFFQIHRGSDGSLLYQHVVKPALRDYVYPMVADVDNDGNAEVLVVTEEGILIIGDRLDNWAGTRRIWNQHTYHITNVNEDGSIPQSEVDNGSLFNNFLQNASILGAPDLTASKISVDQSACPASVEVTARIGNGGGATVPAGAPVTFFDGLPGLGGDLLGTAATSHALAPGEYEDVALTVGAPTPGIHGVTVVADLQTQFDNLAWLPGTTAQVSSSKNGLPADRTIDGNSQTSWCTFRFADASPFLKVTFPHPVDISSVTMHPFNDGGNPTYFSSGTLRFSNGFEMAITLVNGGGTFDVPLQQGVTSVHFIDAQYTNIGEGCLTEFIVSGKLSALPGVDGRISRIDDAVIAYWPLDSSAQDQSGRGNHGTISGSPEVVPGIASPGLQFDGTDDYIIKDPFTEFPTSEITVAFWMKSSDSTKKGTAFSYATSVFDDEFRISNYRNFWLCRRAACRDTGVSANDGAWHHIAVTWNSGGEIKLYKDGALAWSGGGLASGTPIASGGALVLGQDQDSLGGGFQTSQAFLGTMDEVKIFNRALSPEEIALEHSLRRSSEWLNGNTVGEGREDNNEATLGVQLCETTVINNPPSITSSPVTSTPTDALYTYQVVANDQDGDPLAFGAVLAPTGMTVEADTGLVQWTPSPTQVGNHNISLQVSDGKGRLDVQSYTLTVTQPPPPPNSAPRCADVNITLNEDTIVSRSVLCSDPDVRDTIVIEIVSMSLQGTTSLVGRTATYDPDADYNGPDSFTYRARDNHGAESANTTATITVNPVNDPPVANPQEGTTAEDTSLDITLTASDVEGDPLSFALIIQPYHGTLTGSAPNLTYRPDANYNGPDVFTFRANDGQADSNIATVSIAIDPVNDPPVADDQVVTTDEDTAVTITLTASDVDADALTYSIVAGPDHGTLSGMAPDLTYTPDADYSGPDSFTFQANDGTVDSNVATVSITVNAVNDAPVADDQAVTTDEDTAVTITLTASDVDGDALTYSIVAGPGHGTLSGTAPDLSYTPDADYYGPDSFTFKANDGTVDSNAATVSITVNPVNDAPLAADDSATTDEDTSVTIDVLANDADVDGDLLTVNGVTQPANGAAVINGDNTVTYTPAAGYSGTDSFTYTISDGNGGTAMATVAVTISPAPAGEFQLGDFVAFSVEFTWLRSKSKIISGSVGANTSLPDHDDDDGDDHSDKRLSDKAIVTTSVVSEAAEAVTTNALRASPQDDDRDRRVEVRVGEHVQMLDASSKVVGDTVRLDKSSTVYDVHYNELINKKASILGDEYTPLDLPALTLPALPDIAPGSEDIEVEKKGSLTLAPGHYSELTIKNQGTLILTGGVYHVSSLEIHERAKLLFQGPSEVRVKNEMRADGRIYIGPDPSTSVSGLGASGIIFYVEGVGHDDDDDEGDSAGVYHDGDDEGSSHTVVTIGGRSTVLVNIYAPNGTVRLKSRTKGTGAFIGKRVRIEEKVELELDSAF